MAKATRLFDSMYTSDKETSKERRKPLVEKKLKRKLESAWDSIQEKKIKAEEELDSLRSDVEKYDINKILENKNIIESSDFTQKEIEKEYIDVFGEAMPKRA